MGPHPHPISTLEADRKLANSRTTKIKSKITSGTKPDDDRFLCAAEGLCLIPSATTTNRRTLTHSDWHHISRLKPCRRQEKPVVCLLTRWTTPAVLTPTY
ncbi:hypothetical protein MHYP_G00072670 [Metynnis hypsauchen]